MTESRADTPPRPVHGNDAAQRGIWKIFFDAYSEQLDETDPDADANASLAGAISVWNAGRAAALSETVPTKEILDQQHAVGYRDGYEAALKNAAPQVSQEGTALCAHGQNSSPVAPEPAESAPLCEQTAAALRAIALSPLAASGDFALLPGLREALKWKPNTPQLENAMTYAWESALKSFIGALERSQPLAVSHTAAPFIAAGPARALTSDEQARVSASDAPKWTPKEAKRLLDFQEAHCTNDHAEAYHQIYWIVSDRAADPFKPWAEVEALARDAPTDDSSAPVDRTTK